jgi:Trk-type K+ transport system membrane component
MQEKSGEGSLHSGTFGQSANTIIRIKVSDTTTTANDLEAMSHSDDERGGGKPHLFVFSRTLGQAFRPGVAAVFAVSKWPSCCCAAFGSLGAGLARFLAHNTFLVAYTTYIVTLALVGGSIIAYIDHLAWIDGFFVATSAVTCTGLSTVSMLSLSSGSFIILSLLTLLGGAMSLLVPPMLLRMLQYMRVRRRVVRQLEAQGLSFYSPKVLELSSVVSQYDLLQESLGLAWKIVMAYVLLFQAIGMWMYFAALSVQPQNPELVGRNITQYADAGFTTVAAFGNAGFMLASNNAVYLKDNPFAYLWICVLILGGATAAPLLLRSFVSGLRYAFARAGCSSQARRALFILDNPRLITHQLFGMSLTVYLTVMLLLINVVQFFLHVVTSLQNTHLERLRYGSTANSIGIDFFTTISTRYAGFQIMDYRVMNRGMLVVTVIFMYVSALPFVATLRATQTKASNLISSGSSKSSMWRVLASSYSFRKGQFLFLFFCISVFVESDRIIRNPEQLSIWYILFEFTSAYANVGLSVGIIGEPYSLSGYLSTCSRVLLILTMLLGRHRGLPANDDVVVDFQFEALQKMADETLLISSVTSPQRMERKSSLRKKNLVIIARRSLFLSLADSTIQTVNETDGSRQV